MIKVRVNMCNPQIITYTCSTINHYVRVKNAFTYFLKVNKKYSSELTEDKRLILIHGTQRWVLKAEINQEENRNGTTRA